jgi:hypothetical protein
MSERTEISIDGVLCTVEEERDGSLWLIGDRERLHVIDVFKRGRPVLVCSAAGYRAECMFTRVLASQTVRGERRTRVSVTTLRMLS